MRLKLHFLPREEVDSEHLSALLSKLGDNTIVVIDTKLTPQQEAHLIKESLKRVSGDFSGIEFGTLHLGSRAKTVKGRVVEFLSGHQRGLTLIGSSSLIEKIEHHPRLLQLHLR